MSITCTTRATAKLAAASFDCCTKCHTAESRVSSSNQAILKSSAACVACHDWLAERVSESLSYIFTPPASDRNKRPLVALAALLKPAQKVEDAVAMAEQCFPVGVDLNPRSRDWLGASDSVWTDNTLIRCDSEARNRRVTVLLRRSHDKIRSDYRLPTICPGEAPSARSPGHGAIDRQPAMC